MEECLEPVGIALQVHGHGPVTGGLQFVQGRPKIGDLERQVVRPRPIVVEEAPQEVVSLHPGRSEDLDAHATLESNLSRRKAHTLAPRTPVGPELAGIARPRQGMALDGNRDMVKVDAGDHGRRSWPLEP
jgi:hypothetical protein